MKQTYEIQKEVEDAISSQNLQLLYSAIQKVYLKSMQKRPVSLTDWKILKMYGKEQVS